MPTARPPSATCWLTTAAPRSLTGGITFDATLNMDDDVSIDGSNLTLNRLGSTAAVNLNIADNINPKITANLIVSNSGTFHTGTGAFLIQN